LGILATGNRIRYQVMLMGGDIVLGICIIALTFPLWSNQACVPTWVYLFIPAVLTASFLFEPRGGGLSFPCKLLRSSSAAVFVFFFLFFFLDGATSHLTLIFCLIIYFFLQLGWQFLFQYAYDSVLLQKNILVIGTGPMAKKVEKLIRDDSGQHQLVGYIATPSDPVVVEDTEIVGDIQNIADIANRTDAYAIVIALTEKRGNLIVDKLVTCKLMGVRIIEFPSFFEMLTGKIPVEDINPSWLVQGNGFLITPFVRLIKRVLDVVLAFLLMVVIAPFLIPVALLIKLTSAGSVIYKQERVGLHGKPFIIYKFRSMTVDAEKETGASWAKEDDPRITSFGAFMRKTRIDELPQLFNVFKGDMSFIGPRPERPEFVEKITPHTKYYQERHAVKPGITGWAQIMYPYGASIGDSIEKLRYDLYYINNLSFILEILIVLETIKVVLFRKGGR
jgi:sugar transferase (PEP-CTERM system associated)